MSCKICVITGARAEYGLLRLIMQGIRDDAHLSLQLIVTGMHLSPEFGSTHQDIINDGFYIDRKVEMLLSSDTGAGMGKSLGIGVIGFVDALSELQPNLIIVLGDRFEILAAVTAALFLQVPILHLHGGERTEGAMDECMRHAITKLAHVHCVATEEYRQRVIQLGEIPARVHCVGGLGVDVIRNTRLMDRTELETALDFEFMHKNLLITFHPETLNIQSVSSQMLALLEALDDLRDTGLIFTLPNADAGGRELIKMIQEFVAIKPNACAYPSLGQLRYLSCMAHCDGLVGNSSSGLLEAPTLKKGVVNIGDRQLGRLQAKNVINCRADKDEIRIALHKLYSSTFQSSLVDVVNPYGDGGASARIIAIIKTLKLNDLMRKPFYDLPAKQNRDHGPIL